MHRTNLVSLAASLVIFAVAGVVRGEDTIPEIKLEHGRFAPAQLVVPANTPFKVRVTNADGAAIEFESFELRRERVVQPGETITVFMPSLSPGTYEFVDDFHSSTPAGAIVAQ